MSKNNKPNNNVAVSMIKSNAGIISVLLLIGLVLSIMSPVFLTTSNIISVLLQISNNMFLALGMTLVIILGGIDLSVGSIVAMSGTLTVGFIVTNGVPMWLALVAGLLMGVA